ncbi:UDP-Glycosyltransferase/glycogen phosphorylase [Coniochaeta ligniaria NRRL 30616]|uniref:UDP-Glycosyltransferase/glycogen phosphorylase n=1 Tax=Coniochaeta ligniaria NRRL 30616 TaxID=1408157 RepID=A0A1J7JC49_9PEZI|nr:UDP-Glycosyltransferase/glycogen phosphorylase [Coniochaeta ligniaria NRRL 30616]
MGQDDPIQPKKILLITNEDRGQANAFLATSDSLLQADPHLELHFASFASLQTAVTATWKHAQLTAPGAREITFHQISGMPMAEGIQNYFQATKTPRQGLLPVSFLSPPGISNTLRAIRDTIPVIVPYDGPQLVEIVTSIVDIIKDVDADLVVIDSLMTAALTACSHLGVKFVCLSPNAIKDFAARTQPYGAGLWKYPALFSGFSYPIPWYQVPLNIFYILYAVNLYLRDHYRQSVKDHLATQTKATLKTPIDLIRSPPPGVKILVGSLPELDFPAVPPAHVFPCGPIVRSAGPLGEADPELAAWLARRPTVYVNLGSICHIEEDRALELARAVVVVLEQAAASPGSGLQVLWKLSKFGEYSTGVGSRMYEILGRWVDADQVRIVDWLQPEPIAVLESGHVVCIVHHGGANSFNEAVIVEMLGIGRLGSRKAKPLWAADELGGVLADVLFGKDSDSIQSKAKALAAVCKERGDGAENAARLLLEECL